MRVVNCTPSVRATRRVTSPGVVDRNRRRVPTPGDFSAGAAASAFAVAIRGA